jgi:hypothetical protein
MSTKSLARGLDFTPAASGRSSLANLWEHGRQILAAITAGREAEHAYRQLVARGVAPDHAARVILTDVLGHK